MSNHLKIDGKILIFNVYRKCYLKPLLWYVFATPNVNLASMVRVTGCNDQNKGRETAVQFISKQLKLTCSRPTVESPVLGHNG